MTRPNARLVSLSVALALASSLCLADAVPSQAAKATIETTAGAEPPLRLTLESFNKMIKAEKALTSTSRDSKLEMAIAMHGDSDMVRRWIKQLEDDKKATETLRTVGLTAREYMRTYLAVLRAYAVTGLQKQGKTVPEPLMAQIPAENLAFVNTHAAEIESWGRKSGNAAVKPNTMEDVYVEQTPPPATDDVNTASQGDGKSPDAAAKPAAAPKKSSKGAKPAPKTEPAGDKP